MGPHFLRGEGVVMTATGRVDYLSLLPGAEWLVVGVGSLLAAAVRTGQVREGQMDPISFSVSERGGKHLRAFGPAPLPVWNPLA